MQRLHLPQRRAEEIPHQTQLLSGLSSQQLSAALGSSQGSTACGSTNASGHGFSELKSLRLCQRGPISKIVRRYKIPFARHSC